MGMSEVAKQRMLERFGNISTLARNGKDIPDLHAKALRSADELLDQYLDCRDRATEWDADRWGLG